MKTLDCPRLYPQKGGAAITRPQRLRSCVLFCLLGMIILFGLASPARVPSTHEHEGTISSLDFQSNILVLAAPPKPRLHFGGTIKPFQFFWNGETLFLNGTNHVHATAFKPGDVVRLFYRYSSRKEPPLLLKVIPGKQASRSP